MYPMSTLPKSSTIVKPTVGKGELRFFFFLRIFYIVCNERSEISMSTKELNVLMAVTIGSIAIGTTVIYRKIDAIRHKICSQNYWFYIGTDGKRHDLI